MKTAVSIPNDVFRRADRLAKRLKTSRSALYATALREYLTRHEPNAVRKQIDEYVRKHGDEVDPGILEAGRRILRGIEWEE